jgi:transcriptional regulator
MNSQQEREQRTDLGLELMRRWAKPGVRYSCETIAAWTETTAQNIQRIEKRALEKVRRALRKKGIKSLPI